MRPEKLKIGPSADSDSEQGIEKSMGCVNYDWLQALVSVESDPANFQKVPLSLWQSRVPGLVNQTVSGKPSSTARCLECRSVAGRLGFRKGADYRVPRV